MRDLREEQSGRGEAMALSGRLAVCISSSEPGEPRKEPTFPPPRPPAPGSAVGGGSADPRRPAAGPGAALAQHPPPASPPHQVGAQTESKQETEHTPSNPSQAQPEGDGGAEAGATFLG